MADVQSMGGGGTGLVGFDDVNLDAKMAGDAQGGTARNGNTLLTAPFQVGGQGNRAESNPSGGGNGGGESQTLLYIAGGVAALALILTLTRR